MCVCVCVCVRGKYRQQKSALEQHITALQDQVTACFVRGYHNLGYSALLKAW